MTQAKNQSPKCSIGVYSDKGSLRLSFSTRYNALLEQLGQPARRQHTFALNLPDTEQNRKRAIQVAIDIESDLQHKDWVKLFDPTFVKYGIGDAKFAQKLANVINLPTATPQMTVGELWEDYLLWKEGQVQPTTFKSEYVRKRGNAIKGTQYNRQNGETTNANNGIYNLPLDATIGEKAHLMLTSIRSKPTADLTLAALREAFDRAVNLGKIPPNKNPFAATKGETNNNQIYEPKQDTEGVWREWWYFEDATNDEYLKDTRHFSVAERDAIVKAFYEAETGAKHHAATLIEFLLLTGCRHGEAFGLRWKDVNFERGYVRFSKSFDKRTNTTKRTKTNTVRMFQLYPKLTELLLRIQANSSKTGKNDLVFTLMSGNAYGTQNLDDIWREEVRKRTNKAGEEVEYTYPGIVTQLAQEGVIGGYLKPYSTRHTFITLQAQAGTSLPLLAAICGNTVDVIHRHYLGIDKDAKVTNI